MSAISGATLKPAFGRDPRTIGDVIAEFEKGRDFRGYKLGVFDSYCSIRDFQHGDEASIRYGARGEHKLMVRVEINDVGTRKAVQCA